MILTATPLEIFDPVSEDEPPYDMWADEGNSSLRAVLLGVLLVGLGVWSYFGQPEERIIDLIGYLDEKMDIGLVQPSDGLIEFSETDPVVPFDQPATAATSEESASALDQPGDDEVSTDAGELTANTDLDQMSTESEALERYFVVSVSEGDGAARITMPRIEPSESPLVWWTSEHTATADKDYISISQQAVDDESFDAGGALYIPLINDSLREPPESFFVNLGRINSAQGPAELVVTIRVDLFDDD